MRGLSRKCSHEVMSVYYLCGFFSRSFPAAFMFATMEDTYVLVSCSQLQGLSLSRL